MKPKISVVTTTFNRKNWLKRAVKSVLRQSFVDFELIVIDDGSTDKTEQMMHKWAKKEPRIKYLRRAKNYGQHTRPKNQGIRFAKADFICFLDDDNVYRKDHLQALWMAMKANKGYIIYGDRIVHYRRKGLKKTIKGIASDFNAKLLTQQNYIDTSDVIIPKSALLEIGGWDETLPYFGDWNLWLRLFNAGYNFRRLPLPITEYYLHKGCNVLNFEKTKKIPFDTRSLKIWPKKTIFGKQPKLKVAVFTLTYNRLKYTKQTFKSLRSKTKYPFDHYVIDNGSTDGTVKWLTDKYLGKSKVKTPEEYWLVKDGVPINSSTYLYLNPENVGISKASNQAISQLNNNYDVVVKVDNDCKVIDKGWLETIVEVNEYTKRAVLSPYVEGLIDHPGGSPRRSDGYIGKNKIYIGKVDHVGGICCAAPMRAYENFKWNENDFLHGMQDLIFSKHCANSGYFLAYLENVRVEHLFDTSDRKDNPDKKTKAGKEYLDNRFKKEKLIQYGSKEYKKYKGDK